MSKAGMPVFPAIGSALCIYFGTGNWLLAAAAMLALMAIDLGRSP